MSRVNLSFLNDIAAMRCCDAGKATILDLEFLAVHFVVVCAVRQTGGEIDSIGKIAYIDYGCTLLAAVYQ